MAGLENRDEMFDLRMSEGAKSLFEKVKAFIKEEVEPITLEFHQLGERRTDRWSWAPGQERARRSRSSGGLRSGS